MREEVSSQSQSNTDFNALHLAGHRAPSGIYRDIETRREIRLAEPDMLPASLDGRVACYERVEGRGEEEALTNRAITVELPS